MNVQMKTVSYLEQQHAYDKEISIECSWEMSHFTDTLEGFLGSGRVFTKITHYPVDPKADYAVFDNICYNYDEYDRVRKNQTFHLVYRVSESKSWAEVYQHN